MAIQYVGGRGAGRAGSTSTVNVAINSGLTGGIAAAAAAGDLIVVTVSVATQARNPSCAVAGYTAKTQQHTTTTTYDISVCTSYKISTGDTSVTIPSTGNIADGQGYVIHVFRGVDADNIESIAATYAASQGTNNNPNGAAITPGHAGAWIYVGGGGAAGTGTTVFTAAAVSGFLSYNGADTNDGTVGAGYYSGWSAGAYDPAAFGGGSTNAANSWGCTTLALRAAAVVFTGTGVVSQPPQTVAAAGSAVLTITGTGAVSQAPQTLSATGAETLSGTAQMAQEAQLCGAVGEEAFQGEGAFSQEPQVLVASEGEAAPSFTGTGSWVQEVQTFLAEAEESFNAEAALSQAEQEMGSEGGESFAGEAVLIAAAQEILAEGTHEEAPPIYEFTGEMTLTQALQILSAEGDTPVVEVIAPKWRGPRTHLPSVAKIKRLRHMKGRLHERIRRS
jgi:hypothetical protein